MNTDTVQMIGFMNQNELFEYIQFLKNLFNETILRIEDRDQNKYIIAIGRAGIWINRENWASSVTATEDLSSIKYPVYTV